MSKKDASVFYCPICLAKNVIAYMRWSRIHDRPEQHGKIPIKSIMQCECERCRFREIWLPDDLRRAGLI